jgi:hypothetical protein
VTESEFWQLIEEAKAESHGDSRRQVSILEERLTVLPEVEILDFDYRFIVRFRESYHWDLWGAAALMESLFGGCSPDAFDYFRGWLIAQGRTVYENALSDADSLADIVTAEDITVVAIEESTMLNVTTRAYWRHLGRDPDNVFEDIPSYWMYDPLFAMSHEPWGERWEDDAELDQRYPRLAVLARRVEELFLARHPRAENISDEGNKGHHR